MIVLDCSAAVEIALQSEEGRALSSLVLSGEKTIAPSFMKVEAANVAWKHVRKGYIDAIQAQELLSDVLAQVDEFVPEDDLLVEAVNEGIHLKHSVYDLCYAVLARRTGATLATCDNVLQDLCLQHGINCIAEAEL